MGIDDFLRLGQVAIETAMLVAAPVLVLGLVVGLAVSILQAATQISDGALAFIPKIAAALAGILIFGHFMINRIAGFTTWVYGQIPSLSP
jgi:flagellar biosynthesis protein FliQ